jgi:predicted nucleic acid-binding protein
LPTILVGDTNIWIDLREGGVLSKAFKLPYSYVVPDLLYADELAAFEGPELLQLGLTIEPMTSEEVGRVELLAQDFTRPGTADLTALALALSRGWVLVSGDRDLRWAAEQAGCKVHGTIWLMHLMVTHKLLLWEEAVARVDAMIRAGRRLPRLERK